jgi:hypothetical protein
MISPEFLLRLDRWRVFDREELERLRVPRSRAFCAGVPKKRICFADIFRRPRFAMILSRVVWAMFYLASAKPLAADLSEAATRTR